MSDATYYDWCHKCDKRQPIKSERISGGYNYRCVVCNTIVDQDFDDDDYDYDRDPDEFCPTCGGEGIAEYCDCPEAWDEDCPSEVNHLITCPNCKGSGRIEDCDCV